jgi:hypothetical protein
VIAVLVSPRQRGLDLLSALGDDVERCVVITGGPVPVGAERAAALVTVSDYRTEKIVRATIEFPVERVVSFAEADVLAAAELRDRLDLPGQHGDSARAYRDKVMMRQHALEAGLPTPDFATVETAQDVHQFARLHGLPLVLKPRSSSGTVGVRILRSLADLSDKLPNHIVEAFVPGEVVHVDGLVVGGEPVFALPAAYTELGCLAHWSDLGSGSYLLPPDYPWFQQLVDELWHVVDAFPSAPDLLLHAEFFVVPGERPVLCEIASRMPGHPIPPMLDRALGLDLRETWLRIGSGLPVDLDAIRSAAARATPVANFGLPPLAGTLVSLPNQPRVDWLHDFTVLAEPGFHADYDTRKSGDFVLTWTVTAPDEAVLRKRLEESAGLLERQVVWR